MASSQSTPTKSGSGRRPLRTPTKSPGTKSDFKYIKVDQLATSDKKFILRARLIERTQIHKKIAAATKNEFNLVRFLLSDETGCIQGAVFTPQAETFHEVKLGQVYDFYIQKASSETARDPIKDDDKDFRKYYKPNQVHFELHVNYLAKYFSVNDPCPSIPEIVFLDSIFSRLKLNRQRSDNLEEDVERFNVMGVVNKIYEFCDTDKEEREGNQFDIMDESCETEDKRLEEEATKAGKNLPDGKVMGEVVVIQVGAKQVKDLVCGSIVVLIGAYFRGGTIVSDNQGWMQVVEPDYNKKAMDLHDWISSKERNSKKSKNSG